MSKGTEKEGIQLYGANFSHHSGRRSPLFLMNGHGGGPTPSYVEIHVDSGVANGARQEAVIQHAISIPLPDVPAFITALRGAAAEAERKTKAHARAPVARKAASAQRRPSTRRTTKPRTRPKARP